MHLEMTACHILFRITVTLTSDLFLRIIVFGAYPLFSLRLEFQSWCEYSSWDGSVSYHFRVTVTLPSDLGLMILVSGANLLYYLK